MLTAVLLAVGVASALPSQAADTITVPVLANTLIAWGQPSVSAPVDFPSGTFSSITVTMSDNPDQDYYDRLFGVLVDGVEVVRGTTPRANWTTTQDVTRYAAVLTGHRTAAVNLLSYQGIGHYVSLSFTFHRGTPPAGVATSIATPFSFEGLAPHPDNGCPGGNTGDIDPSVHPQISETRSFVKPGGPVASSTLLLYLTAHGCDEFFYTTVRPKPLRTVHVLLDGKQVASFAPTPYTYALIGFSSKSENSLIWWNAAQRNRERLGLHTGVGVIAPYSLSPAALAALSPGTHTLGITIDNGSSYWVLSAELLFS